MKNWPKWKKSLLFACLIFMLYFGVFLYSINLINFQSQSIAENLDRIELSGKNLTFVSKYENELIKNNIGYMDAIVDRAEKTIDKDILDQIDYWKNWFAENKDFYRSILKKQEHITDFKKSVVDIQLLDNTVDQMFESIKNGAPDSEYQQYDNVLDSTTKRILARNEKVIESIRSDYQEAVTSSKVLNEISEKVKFISYFLLGMLFFLATTIFYSIRSIVSPIRDNVTVLNKSVTSMLKFSNNLDELSNDLNFSTNEQNSAVQESVAAMEEIKGMTNRTLESIDDSREGIKKATSKTTEGGRIMRDMSASIDDIKSSNSKLNEIVEIISKISEKTTVINDIVFKTQLLSFNASIEAARAGEHGKGFAVVAEEVGNLAATSGEAAREITSLLENSQKNVSYIVKETEEMTTKAQDACYNSVSAFEDIATNIESVSGLIETIQVAAREQEVGMLQTSKALQKLGETAADNNSLSRKVRDISVNLKDEGDTLGFVRDESNKVVIGENYNNLKRSEKNKAEKYRDEFLKRTNEKSFVQGGSDFDDIDADHDSFKKVS